MINSSQYRWYFSDPQCSSFPLLHRFTPIDFPGSVHLYFYDDRFQGYLVRQEVKSLASGKKDTLEVWVVPQATLQLESNLHEFERLKNLEVRAINNILTLHTNVVVY